MTNVLAIPYVSDQALKLRASRIRPIVSVDGVKKYLSGYDIDEIKNDSYINSIAQHEAEVVDEEKLEEVCTINTLHKCASQNQFRPSIAEVLAQIPRNCRDEIVAFEINEDCTDNIESVELFSKEAAKAGFHSAQVKLYRNK